MSYFHGGDIYAASQRWGLPPERFLDFSANINPLGPPEGALAAAREALAGVAHYPEPFARTLRAALASHHAIPEESILVTNGAAEALYLVLRLAAGQPVALPVPGFAEYGRAVEAVGARAVPYPYDHPPAPAAGWRLVNNPHNPTGHLLTSEALLALPRPLLVDEAFIDLTPAGEAGSVLQQAAREEGLVVVRSLTKFYALPGLRVGYAVAHPDLVRQFDATRDPWSVSEMAQAAALAALRDKEYAARTRAWVESERPFLFQHLTQLPGYIVHPPSANFILAEGSEPAASLQERLGPQGILVRDCRSFEGLTPRHIRVAVRSRAENLRLLEALCP